MSDFWKQRLAQARPQQAPAAQPAQAASQAWWQQGIPQRPQPVPAPQPQHQPEQPQEYKPHQAKSAQAETTCPSCYKDTLLPVPGQPNIRPRCTACGYPVEHSTSGMHVPTEPGAPVAPARQVSTANNFSFGNVFAHIGPNGSVS
ncbi:hypothetical protein [Nonomuraea sp. SYSU D8015]|uniref:hypothetical protein n=1 Tax=Nonomuraea sp. SYSU D8015 TaxID=2593644 RepID=UPI0016603B17|nr:hypothetical protein [Nonomuraea sp. SYSU D8015]